MPWESSGKFGAVERAFELARSGSCLGIPELRARLTAEGYSARQIEGPSLIRQLRELLRTAREAASNAGES